MAKVIRGISKIGNYFDYEVNGKEYWIQGELYFNKDKNRYEHTHIGKRGGTYLIVWYV